MQQLRRPKLSLLARAPSQTAAFGHCFGHYVVYFRNRVGADRMVSTASTPSFENQLLKRANSSSILFFGVPVCTTFSFGVLQMKRLDEKRNLFKNPNMVFGWPRLQSRPRQCEHSRLPQTHHHRYLAARERNAGGSHRKNVPPSALQSGESSGFLVVTPVRTGAWKIVLVNRGWIPP